MSSTSFVNRETSEYSDKAVQTVVKVYPFVLPPSIPRASVLSDKKFCTVLSLEVSKDNAKFYSLLQYTPYHDIEEQSLRTINLPRKTKLQWVSHNQFSENILKQNTLADDDGVADMCNDLLLTIRSGKKISFVEAETQTDLMVRPYLLEEPKVATVYRSIATQVSPNLCGKRNSLNK